MIVPCARNHFSISALTCFGSKRSDGPAQPFRVTGRLPSAEISWIVDTLADEFPYMAPLGFQQVLCSMSAQEGRFSMNLHLLLRIPSFEIASYLGSGISELALAQATQNLPGFETKVKAREDQVSISVLYRLEGFNEERRRRGSDRMLAAILWILPRSASLSRCLKLLLRCANHDVMLRHSSQLTTNRRVLN